jgi:hypothetical protein
VFAAPLPTPAQIPAIVAPPPTSTPSASFLNLRERAQSSADQRPQPLTQNQQQKRLSVNLLPFIQAEAKQQAQQYKPRNAAQPASSSLQPPTSSAGREPSPQAPRPSGGGSRIQQLKKQMEVPKEAPPKPGKWVDNPSRERIKQAPEMLIRLQKVLANAYQQKSGPPPKPRPKHIGLEKEPVGEFELMDPLTFARFTDPVIGNNCQHINRCLERVVSGEGK